MNNIIPFPTEIVRAKVEGQRLSMRLAAALRMDWFHDCPTYGKRLGGIKGRKCAYCGQKSEEKGNG